MPNAKPTRFFSSATAPVRNIEELDLEDLADEYATDESSEAELVTGAKTTPRPSITKASKTKTKRNKPTGEAKLYDYADPDAENYWNDTAPAKINSIYRPRSFLGRGNTASRVTSALGSLFGLGLVSAIWLYGASSSVGLLREQKLAVDATPWNWIIWPILVGVTCFQIRYMPPFFNLKRLLLSLRYHPWITGLWLFIAGLDMGSTFHALLPQVMGRSLSLYIWDVNIAGPVATVVAAILAALVGLGPEPLARVFARLLADDLKL